MFIEPLITSYIGNSENTIIISKCLFAFVWANIWYLLHINYFHSKWNIVINYWFKWLLYSISGMFWALILLWPSSIDNAFISGIVWMVTLTNFFREYNKWAENKNSIDKKLSTDEISEIYIKSK